MAIKVERLSKRFGDFHALRDVTFDVPSGDLFALLGPSGSGKSTILRVIAGLEDADEGAVFLDGERVDHLHAGERRVGFVFQHYALFRHMSVADNIAFGLDVSGAPKSKQKQRVDELLHLIGLLGLGGRYPAQLSGGQRQRVALARALAPAPRLLLLDEPFAAVDAKVRAELRSWLRRLHDEMHVTSLFVTHDQEEAFAVADHAVLMNHGRIEQIGAPADILDEPKTEFVARFVGDVNVLDATVKGHEAHAGPIVVKAPGFDDDARVHVLVRSYDLKIWRAEGAGIGAVRRVIRLGDRVRVEVTLDGGAELFAQFPRRSSLLEGVEPGVRIDVEITLARVYPAVEVAKSALPRVA
ncbi:sulfate ABC transporter ATP-binding protein [Myxococcota bacterium]|nr:sulfate ABC transporter ATP-binding protein [Myxococcota bacterium]